MIDLKKHADILAEGWDDILTDDQIDRLSKQVYELLDRVRMFTVNSMMVDGKYDTLIESYVKCEALYGCDICKNGGE